MNWSANERPIVSGTLSSDLFVEKTDENARHISGENVVSSVKLVNENLLFLGKKKKMDKKLEPVALRVTLTSWLPDRWLGTVFTLRIPAPTRRTTRPVAGWGVQLEHTDGMSNFRGEKWLNLAGEWTKFAYDAVPLFDGVLLPQFNTCVDQSDANR